MRYMKKTLTLLGLGGFAAIGVWQWVQHQSSFGPLPSDAGVPALVAQDVASQARFTSGAVASTDASEGVRRQKTQKNANDVESLARAFKEANDCLLYHVARHELNIILTDDRLQDLSNETLKTLENIDAASSRYLSIARQTEAFCMGSNQEALADVYIDSILKAALLGDPDAESCFVIGNVSPLEKTTAESLEFLENRYLKYAPVFTRKALERADPYVAENALYRYIRFPIVHPSRLDNLQKADPFLTWRAARLASLRALPEQRVRLESGLALFKEQNLLRPDDIKRADAWARAVYEQEFAGQPPINLDSHVPCYSRGVLVP